MLAPVCACCASIGPHERLAEVRAGGGIGRPGAPAEERIMTHPEVRKSQAAISAVRREIRLNPRCDGAHCAGPDGEVRVYPRVRPPGVAILPGVLGI
jgi:hypothetical protein